MVTECYHYTQDNVVSLQSELNSDQHFNNCMFNLCIRHPLRFILAIDRRNSLEVAAETVRLAEEYRVSSGGIVVGIDQGFPTFWTRDPHC